MSNGLTLKMRITADGREAKAEIVGVGDATSRTSREMARDYSSVGRSITTMGDASAQASRKINAGHSKTKQGLKSISTQLARTKKELIGFFAIQQFTRMATGAIGLADSYSLLRSRVDEASGSAAVGKENFQAIFDIAQRHGASLDAVGQSFLRFDSSVREMGGTSAETAIIIDSVNAALRLSGASASESAAAQIQLSQAFGSGVLRGDEFNSIMENGRSIADVLAKHLNVTTGELRAMAADGEITAQVMREALVGAHDELIGRTDKLQVTAAQGWTKFSNSVMVFVGEADKATGVTSALATGLTNLSGWVTSLAEAVADHGFAPFTDSLVLAAQAAAALYLAKKLGPMLFDLGTKAKGASVGINLAAASSLRLKTQLMAGVLWANKAKLAMGGLKTVLGFLGGPAGVAILAGMALFQAVQSTETLQEVTFETTRAAEDLSMAMGDEVVTARQVALEKLKVAEAALLQAKADREATREVGKHKRAHQRYIQRTDKSMSDLTERIAEMKAAIAEADVEIVEMSEGLAKTGSKSEALKDRLSDTRAQTEALQSETKKLTAEQKDAQGAADDYANKLNALVDRLNPAEAAARTYRQELQMLQDQAALGVAGATQNIAKLAEEYTNSQKKGVDSLKAVSKEVEGPFNKAITGMVERIDEGFASAWKGSFDSFSDFAGKMVDATKNMLAEMAHAAITRPITVGIQRSMSGFVAGGSGGMSVPGIGGSGGASGGFGGIENLFMGNSIGTSMMKMGDMISPGLLENAGMVSNAGFGVAGLLGGALGSQAGGYGSTGGSIGAMIGMATPLGPLGAAIGGALGSAVGSLFGSKWETKDQGINLDYAHGQVGGQNYQKESRKRLFRTRTRYSYEGLDSSFSDTLNASMDAVEQSVVKFAEALGKDGVAALEGFTANAHLSLRGLNEEEAQQVINDWVIQTGGEMLVAVTPFLSGLIDNAGSRVNEMVAALFTLGDYIALDFAPVATQSLWEAGKTQLQSLNDVVLAFDGSVDSANDMAAAVQDRAALEVQMVAYIDQAASSIEAMFGQTRERILQDTLTSGELYTRYRDEAERLAEEMRVASDPEEIARLAQEGNAAINNAYRYLSAAYKEQSDRAVEQINNDAEAQQRARDQYAQMEAETREGFLTFIDDFNAQTQNRLASARSEILNEHDQVATAIEDKLAQAAAQTVSAATDLRESTAGLRSATRGLDELVNRAFSGPTFSQPYEPDWGV